MNRGNLILAIGTIKIFVIAGEVNDAVKVCDGLLDELIHEIDMEETGKYCKCEVTPRINGICVTCGLPRKQ